MEGLIGGTLCAALKAHRARFNALFAQARQRNRGIEPEAFATHLRACIAPIVDACPAENAERVACVLVEFCIEQFAHAMLGEEDRFPSNRHAWKTLYPALANRWPSALARLLAQSANALSNLERSQTPMIALRWVDLMSAILKHTEAAKEWSRAGLVCAWRCGMPHWRESALRVWQSLPPKLQRVVLGLHADDHSIMPEDLQVRLQDPWCHPAYEPKTAAPARLVGEAGGFAGFDGSFIRPPLVYSNTDGLYVYDGENCFALFADVFGVTLQRIAKPPEDTSDNAAPYAVDANGTLHHPGGSMQLEELSSAFSVARYGNTLAVSLVHSHAIQLLALPMEDR